MDIRTPVRHKTISEIVAQCIKQRVPHIAGTNVIYVGRPSGLGGGHATYNAVNGIFYGVTDKGVRFHSTERFCDRYGWMQALRAFFHEEIKA